ncbi:MAG: hypothetical protein WC533_02325 [Candidatus Pacearchaeota archaeon]
MKLRIDSQKFYEKLFRVDCGALNPALSQTLEGEEWKDKRDIRLFPEERVVVESGFIPIQPPFKHVYAEFIRTNCDYAASLKLRFAKCPPEIDFCDVLRHFAQKYPDRFSKVSEDTGYLLYANGTPAICIMPCSDGGGYIICMGSKGTKPVKIPYPNEPNSNFFDFYAQIGYLKDVTTRFIECASTLVSEEGLAQNAPANNLEVIIAPI